MEKLHQVDLIVEQVPFKTYLIVGDGRLARHLSVYFRAKGMAFKTWNRKEENRESLYGKIKNCDFILLCLPDDRISPFWQSLNSTRTIGSEGSSISGKTGQPHPSGRSQQAVHFSGSLFHPDIPGFHPLMSFDLKTYEPKIYEEIPFVGIHEPETFKNTFPGLGNPYLRIKKEEQELYHSLCVLAGNGTNLLWDLVGQYFTRMGIENHHLKPYMQKVFENISHQTRGRWSGPWYREDKQTIEKNRNSLNGSPLKKLYEQFFELSKQAGHYHGQRS